MERHAQPPELAAPSRRRRQAEPEEDEDSREAPIRPERFARLVTLAGILIEAARESRKLEVAELCDTLQVTDQELRQDIDVLNVVNFGGGSYVLYAEVQGDQIEVDPEPYGDNFAQPARLLPLEAKALVAAIDLIGEHLPEGSLASARKKIVDALGQDPAEDGLQITTAKGDDSDVARVVSGAIIARRQLRIEYYKENEDEFTERTIEPYKLVNGQEGWYIHSWDLDKDKPRSYRLDRVREVNVLDETFEPRPGVEPDVHGWLATGEVESGSTAKIWVSPERARWVREDHPAATELSDGALDLRAHLRLLRVARPRDPEGGGRRRGARAGGGPHAQCSRPRSSLPSRRSQIEMSDEEVRDFLAERMVMQCATNGPRGLPHVVPLWFVADPDLTSWTYAKSQKAVNLERDPRATLGFEDGVQYHELRGVMLECDVVLERDPERVEQFGLELFERYAGELNGRDQSDGRSAGAEAHRAHVRSYSYGDLGPP